MPLPHINNVQAGINKYDPMHGAIFEVQFTLPDLISGQFIAPNDIYILSEQVTTVTGLDILQKTVQAGSQKFLGVDVSFLNPAMDSTFAEFTVELNLNLRNDTDAYVLRVFKAWSKLGYNLSNGSRTLKREYCSASMRILEANRNGVIWRDVLFKDVMLTEVTGLDGLDYTNSEARKLTCKFRSDYWDEFLGSPDDQPVISGAEETIGNIDAQMYPLPRVTE
jgi:hypothetical protein